MNKTTIGFLSGLAVTLIVTLAQAESRWFAPSGVGPGGGTATEVKKGAGLKEGAGANDLRGGPPVSECDAAKIAYSDKKTKCEGKEAAIRKRDLERDISSRFDGMMKDPAIPNDACRNFIGEYLTVSRDAENAAIIDISDKRDACIFEGGLLSRFKTTMCEKCVGDGGGVILGVNCSCPCAFHECE